MKNKINIRRPSLAKGTTGNKHGEALPVGDVLRKAKKDLLLSRCLYGVIAALVIAIIVFAVINGYLDSLVDSFFSLIG